MVCRFGCPGRPDDLRHYIRCARAWPPIFRALSMLVPHTWPAHLAIEGTPAQRVAAVRAWLAVYRSYRFATRPERGGCERNRGWSGSCPDPPPTRYRGGKRWAQHARAKAPLKELRVPHLS